MFHILLFAAFLLADVDIKGELPEEEILIELPELMMEPEVPEEEQEIAEQQESEPVPNEASAPQAESQSQRSNIASNRLAQNDKFFDEDYLQELEEAQKLVSDVNNQLAKEKVNWEDIKMPVRTTEGMNPDSIGNSVYTGESNIVYYLENRYHRSLPIPVYLTRHGGKVVVDIIVDRQGEVISAEPQKSSGIHDEDLYLYAKAAASRTIFNADPNAPDRQRGTIHYTFIAQ